MCHVAKNRQSEFLQRPLGLDNALKERNDTGQGRILLSRLAQAAQVVHSVQHLVADIAEMRELHACVQQVRQHLNGVAVLQCVQCRGKHTEVLDELQHGDLVIGTHPSQVFKHALQHHSVRHHFFHMVLGLREQEEDVDDAAFD